MVGDPKVMTFISGEEPGGYTLGIQHPDDLGLMAARKLHLAKMAVGGEVAVRFPWWRRVTQLVPHLEKVTLERAGWQATFFNSSDHDVDVDEIRFRLAWATAPATSMQTLLACKIGIPPRREVIADWIPVMSLHTANEKLIAGNVDSFTYELPAPYILQRGNQFVMDVRYDASQANINPDEWSVMIGLHGYGLFDGEPISLMKAVQGWPNTTGMANQWQVVPFDESQDRPMRDAVITHISFGAALTCNDVLLLEGIQFRPHAPEGPEWHLSEFYAIRDVAEQVGRITPFDDYSIHRPVVPYRLLKGEGMLVQLWNASTTNDVTVDVILRGSQVRR